MNPGQYQTSNVPALGELAAIHQLGQLIDSYPYQQAQGIIVIIVFLFIILGEVIIGLPTAFLIVSAPFLLHPTSARDSISPVAQLGITLFGVLLVAVFLGVIWFCVKRIITSCRDFGATIYLYQRELIRA